MGKTNGRERQTARVREYLIQDRAALAELLRDTINRRYGGSQNEAAKAVGVPRSVLGRFCAGQSEKVRHETMERLRQLLAVRLRQLEAAVFSPAARDALARYYVWLDAETEAALAGVLRTRRRDLPESEIDFTRAMEGVRSRTERARRLIARLKGEYADERAPLERALIAGGHTDARAQLALARVVSPLLDADESGLIEREQSEFTSRELREFIRAGIKRETLLLKREPDLRRAQGAPQRALPFPLSWSKQ
jgi:transcriptional regulator with XRE-family HTH domain